MVQLLKRVVQGPARSVVRGQSAVEYALFTSFMLFGGAAALGLFLPTSLKSYEHYVHGFWLVLSLPIP